LKEEIKGRRANNKKGKNIGDCLLIIRKNYLKIEYEEIN
jgi:hypothetical protein